MDIPRCLESTSTEERSRLPAERPLCVRAESSPMFGDRRAPERLEGRYPVNTAYIVPRPPPPYPNSTRSISPASLGSSNGSIYLNPPAEADGETPPYKPNVDDSISLNMYKDRKRKRRAKHGQSDRSATNKGTKPASFPVAGMHEAQGVTIDASSRKGLPRKSNDSHSQKSVQWPRKLSRTAYEPRRRSNSNMACPSNTTVVDQISWLITNDVMKNFAGYLLRPARQIPNDRPSSSRRNPDKISQALTGSQCRRWSTMEAGAVPVPTFSTALAFQRSKGYSGGKHLIDQPSTYYHFPIRPSTGDLSELSPGVGHCERLSMKSKKLRTEPVDTPATITLRRASGTHAYQTIRKESGPALSPALSFSLPVVEESQEPANLVTPNLSQSYPLVSRECRSFSEQARTRGINTSKQCLPRRSVVAETAMTYADVHVAPPLVASNVTEQESAPPIAKLQQISAMQIRSRSSIHEIIWKDDYSSSSKSSLSHKSPPPSVHLLRTQSDPLKYETCMGLGTNHERNTERNLSCTGGSPHAKSPSLSGDFTADVQSGNVAPGKIAQKLIEWSWNRKPERDKTRGGAVLSFESRPTSAAVRGEDGPAKLLLSLNSSIAISSSPPDAPVLLSGFRSAEPFPPLPDQNPTVRWQAAPLMGPENPRVGLRGIDQVTGDVNLPNRILDHRNSVVKQRQQSSSPRTGDTYVVEGFRRQSYVRNHPYAPPRVGDDFAAGSAIGSSTRMHRRSLNAHQRGRQLNT
ncbi:MAG: hypothetical protein M1830_005536 [Pleopsidium flavum]|nr:MAG: hypothetical protein M1830_005536 [Pleopsidium flavum]